MDWLLTTPIPTETPPAGAPRYAGPTYQAYGSVSFQNQNGVTSTKMPSSWRALLL